jgi:hypothetical protein
MRLCLLIRHIHSSRVVVNATHFSWLMVYVCLCIEDWHGNKVFVRWKAWETNNNSYSSWFTYGCVERNGRAIRYLLSGRHGKQAITWVPYVIKQMKILPFPYINKGHKECAKTLSINWRNIACKQCNPLKPYLLANWKQVS